MTRSNILFPPLPPWWAGAPPFPAPLALKWAMTDANDEALLRRLVVALAPVPGNRRRSPWAARGPAARRRPLRLRYRPLLRPTSRSTWRSWARRGRPRRSRRRGRRSRRSAAGAVDRRRRLAGDGRGARRPALSRSRPRGGGDRRRPCRQGRALLSARPSARLPARDLHGRGGLRPASARPRRRARRPAARTTPYPAALARRCASASNGRPSSRWPTRARASTAGTSPIWRAALSAPSPVSARPCLR